jgi:hypothetical protein
MPPSKVLEAHSQVTPQYMAAMRRTSLLTEG